MKFKKTVVDGHFHLYNVYDAYGKDFLSGIDDYMTKPIDNEELLLHIKAYTNILI